MRLATLCNDTIQESCIDINSGKVLDIDCLVSPPREVMEGVPRPREELGGSRYRGCHSWSSSSLGIQG